MEPQALVVTVQCLACSSTYSKPGSGGTTHTNPGCPRCGYVGWSPDGSVNAAFEQPRSDGDRRRAQLVRRR